MSGNLYDVLIEATTSGPAANEPAKPPDGEHTDDPATWPVRQFRQVYKNWIRSQSLVLSAGAARGPCGVCGRTKKCSIHHATYFDPEEFVFLCATCHTLVHDYRWNADVLISLREGRAKVYLGKRIGTNMETELNRWPCTCDPEGVAA